ncbi:MAG: YidH family protein [Chloroflexota bacterium]
MRSSIALMGLGFVVARFGLVLRELAARGSQGGGNSPASTSAAAVIGVALVAAGVISALLGALRFLRVQGQLQGGHFEPHLFTELVVIGLVVIAGVALVVYLVLSQ